MASIQGGESPHEVQSLLNRLEKNLDTNEIPTLGCDEILTRLHVYSRTIRNPGTDPLTTRHGMKVVAGYAFGSEQRGAEARRKALRCLNNILVLAEPMRQAFVDENYPKNVIEILKGGDADDELAAGNLLVLSSVGTKSDLTPYFESHNLAGIINRNIERQAKTGSSLTADPSQPCMSSLKLLSTVAVLCPNEAKRFLPVVQPILQLLQGAVIPAPPLEVPIQPLVSCLAAIPFDDDKAEDSVETWFPVAAAEKLVDVLEPSLKIYSGHFAEMTLGPLLFTLSKVIKAVGQDSDVYRRLQSRLLPTEQDRRVVLGSGQSLPHLVLNLGANSLAPQHRTSIMTMLFDLSNQDPTEFVKNVGFGNAAGYLAEKGISVSQEDLQSRSANAAAEAAINPITGQRLDAETNVDLPEMTTEEKEREAERLFVLFERLRATGVVDVENPAARASRVQESRVQEVNDSDEE